MITCEATYRPKHWDGPGKHVCERKKGHKGKHRCWCDAEWVRKPKKKT